MHFLLRGLQQEGREYEVFAWLLVGKQRNIFSVRQLFYNDRVWRLFLFTVGLLMHLVDICG